VGRYLLPIFRRLSSQQINLNAIDMGPAHPRMSIYYLAHDDTKSKHTIKGANVCKQQKSSTLLDLPLMIFQIRNYGRGDKPNRSTADNVDDGVWWLVGRFSAFCLKGHRFESHSSHHVRTLVKSFSRSCLWRFAVKLRHSIRAVSGASLE